MINLGGDILLVRQGLTLDAWSIQQVNDFDWNIFIDFIFKKKKQINSIDAIQFLKKYL